MKRGRKPEADYGGLTQYEIAKRLGMSRARVSQIEMQAMRKLRAALQASYDRTEGEREKSYNRSDAEPNNDDWMRQIESVPEYSDPES